jgi:hypothetical protein
MMSVIELIARTPISFMIYIFFAVNGRAMHEKDLTALHDRLVLTDILLRVFRCWGRGGEGGRLVSACNILTLCNKKHYLSCCIQVRYVHSIPDFSFWERFC